MVERGLIEGFHWFNSIPSIIGPRKHENRSVTVRHGSPVVINYLIQWGIMPIVGRCWLEEYRAGAHAGVQAPKRHIQKLVECLDAGVRADQVSGSGGNFGGGHQAMPSSARWRIRQLEWPSLCIFGAAFSGCTCIRLPL